MSLANRIRTWFSSLLHKPSLGRRGENAAERFLRAQGYRILARGDRNPIGELDLIAEDQGVVVFVEVKTRQSADQGDPAEAVDLDKQRRLTRLALMWLKRHRLLEYPARFDVVAVLWPQGQGKPQIEHIRSAFEAQTHGEFY